MVVLCVNSEKDLIYVMEYGIMNVLEWERRRQLSRTPYRNNGRGGADIDTRIIPPQQIYNIPIKFANSTLLESHEMCMLFMFMYVCVNLRLMFNVYSLFIRHPVQKWPNDN